MADDNIFQSIALENLPTLRAKQGPQRGIISAGLSAGVDELQGMGGAALAAVGKATGITQLEELGAGIAERNQREAQANGRPDLETAPWREGGASVLPWLGYQAVKQLPQIAAMIGAGALVPEAVVPAALARFGASVPAALGGGRALAGEAAAAAGQNWARGMVGATATGYPLGVGSMYQEAMDREQAGGDKAGKGDAFAALAMGLPYAALDATQPTALANLARQGLAKGLAGRLATTAGVGAISEMPQEAAQTAMEMSFRPDLPFNKKMDQIVDAALTGGAIGGVLGGVGGIRGAQVAKNIDTNTPTEQLAQDVDTMMALPVRAPMLALPAPVNAIQMGDSAAYSAPPVPLQIEASRPTVTEPSGQVRSALVEENRPVGNAQAVNPFMEVDTPTLQRAADVFARREEKFGGLDPAQQEQYSLVREALAKKAPEQQDMLENAPTQVAPTASRAVADVAADVTREARGNTADAEATRAQLLTDLGRTSSKTLSNLNYENKAEAIADIQSRVRSGEGLPRDLNKLAEKYGLLSKDGQERDLGAEIAQARADMDRFQSLVKSRDTNGEANMRKALEAQQRVKDLTEMQQGIHDAVLMRGDLARRIAPNARTDQDIAAIQEAEALGMVQEVTRDPQKLGIVPPTAERNTMAQAFDPATAAERNRQMRELDNASRMTNLSPQLKARMPEVRAMFARGDVTADDAYNNFMADVHVETGKTVFSALTAREPGSATLDNDTFAKGFDKFTRMLTPESREGVQVVNSVADLPDGVELAATRKGFDPGNVRAVLHNDQVFIVRNNIRSEADLQEALAHEVFGHVGARNLWGTSRESAMTSLYNSAGGIAGVRNLARKFGVESELEAYIPKGPLNEQQKVEIFDELLAQAAGKATGKFSTALREWAGKVRNGFVMALRKMGFNEFADKISKTDAFEVARMLADMRQAARGGNIKSGDTVFSIDTSVQGVQNAAKSFVEMSTTALNKALPKLGNRDRSIRKSILYVASTHHIVEAYKRRLAGLSLYEAVQSKRDAIAQRMSQMFTMAYDPYTALEKSRPGAARLVRDLMAYTQFNIHPAKPWLEQTHLHNAKNAKTLERLTKEANQKYFELMRAGHVDVYDNMAHANAGQYAATMAMKIYNLIALDPVYAAALASLNTNPMDAFLDSAALSGTPAATNKYWQDTLERQLQAIKEYVRVKEGEFKDLKGSKRSSAEKELTPLSKIYNDALKARETLQKSPYFHLGRSGDFFAAFQVRTLEDGLPDPAALEQIAQRFNDAGFNDIEINRDSNIPRVYIRMDTQDQLANAQRIVQAMQAEKNGPVNADPATARFGLRTKVRDELAFMNPDQLRNFITSLRSRYNEDVLAGMKPSDRANAQEMLKAFEAQATETWMDLMPETAMSKVLAKRDSVPGFTHDMVESFAQRMSIGSHALAGFAVATDNQRAFRSMRDAIDVAQTSKPAPEVVAIQDAFNEIVTRDAQRTTLTQHPILDKWRSINHVYFLGMSISYGMINMLQPAVLLWPELAKKHGFVASAKAMAKVTGQAFDIMRATAEYAYSQRGVQGLPDATITPAAFDKLVKDGKVTQKDVDYLMKLVNRSDIDIGSFARELMNVSAGSRTEQGLDKAVREGLRWGSMVGYYTETYSRILSALSARELNGKKDDQAELDYASHTIKESMLIYSKWNTARAMGRMGIAGKYSEIMFSFMSYSAQVIEKMYREMHTVMSKGASPEERRASRTYLGVHAGVMVTLAGSLGLPGATAIAGAIDKLAGLFGDDDEPYDVKVAWRKFLSDTFGKEFGEVLSRGAVRALGFDISQRAGEGDILPFSRVLTDRRKFEDAAKDWALQTLGSPVGMGMNIVTGMRDISNGNVMEGLIKALPAAFRGGTQAFQLSDKGYVDKAGNKLPMEPGALDILYTAMGFKPSDKANYDERNLAMIARKGEISRRAANIRKNLAEAIEAGDVEDQRKWLAEAKQFDKNQPSFAIMPTIGSVLQRRATARMQAEAMGTPLGANIKDTAGRERIDF